MNYLNYLSIILLASIKFAMAPIVALPLGFSSSEIFICISIGGILGFYVFYYFTDFILRYFGVFKRKKTRKIFTKKNKMIVKIMRKNGLFFLSMLTPTLLSIPVGAFIALRYFGKKNIKVQLFMVGGILFWAAVFSFFNYLFV